MDIYLFFRSNCRMMDADLSCWRKSLDFHTTELVAKMEVVASALLHVNHWRLSNSDPSHSASVSYDSTQGNTSQPRGHVENILEHEVFDEVVSRMNNESTLSERTIQALLLLLLNGVSTYSFVYSF